MIGKPTRKAVLNYLNDQSEESKYGNQFVSLFEEIIDKQSKGTYSIAEDDPNFSKDFQDLLGCACHLQTGFVPYSEITRIVYKNGSNGSDGIDALSLQLRAKIRQEISCRTTTDDDIQQGYIVLIKTVEHMNLASKQFDNLYASQNRSIADLQKKVTSAKQENQKVIGKVKKVRKKVKHLDNIRSSIYGDFVAILGIFSALIFTLFGSFKLVATAISNMNRVPWYRLFMTISLLGIVLLCLLFFLLRAIAVMSEKEITSQPDAKYWVQRYPLFTVGIATMTVLLLMGLLGDIWAHWDIFDQL